MRNYVNMELDDDDKLDSAIPVSGGMKTPDYPWGLRISLTHDDLTKLGMNEDPEIGDLLHFSAFSEVTSYSSGDGENGPHRRVELQIKMISCIEDESTEML